MTKTNRRGFLRDSAAGLAAAGAAWAFPGCGRAPRVPIKDIPDRCVFLTLDTLRADHVGYFGYPRDTAPFLSRLAERSVVFADAYCSCSNTTPSHTSMFTGLHPPQHGMFHNNHAAITPGLYTMAEMFRDIGHDTAGFAAVVWMRYFQQGFRTFDTYAGEYIQDASDKRYYRGAPEVVDLALDWLRHKRPDDKFFLWLHLYDPHDPYYPGEDARAKMALDTPGASDKMMAYWQETQRKGVEGFSGDPGYFKHVHTEYDAEIRYMDGEIARLYQFCERAGLNRNAVWVLTADHGEGLGNHGYVGHGRHIYQEQVRCMTLMHAPDGRLPARRVEEAVQHVDLLPTLAEIHGGSLERQRMTIQGVSLLPLIHGAADALPKRVVYTQRRHTLETATHTQGWPPDPVYAAIDGGFKYIHGQARGGEFYDLARDPFELDNLAEAPLDTDRTAARDRLRVAAQATHDRLRAEGGGDSPGAVDAISPEHEEALRNLGYL